MDMERWAKGVNAAKTAQKQQLKALIQLERAEVVARDAEKTPQQPLGTTVKRSGISLSAALEVHNLIYSAAMKSSSTHLFYYCFWFGGLTQLIDTLTERLTDRLN